MAFFRTILLSLGLFLIGCEAEEKVLFDETPEAAAMNFFNAIYNTRDLNTAFKLSTPRMQRLLESYAAINNVQRHVINLMYDDVTLTLDTGNVRMRTQYADHMRITVILSGMYDGDKIDEVRRVHLVNDRNHWKVDKIDTDGLLGW